MKVKNKYLLKTFGIRVNIFYFRPPGYSVAAQGRKSVHIKNYLLEKKIVKDGKKVRDLTRENTASNNDNAPSEIILDHCAFQSKYSIIHRHTCPYYFSI